MMRDLLRGHLFDRHQLPYLVILIALLGLIVSLVILALNPFGQASIAERAQASSAVSTLFALTAGIVAIGAGTWLASSDFKAQQAVKEDTARLLACFRSVMVKGATLDVPTAHQQLRDTNLTFESERKVLDDFLSSTTAFAYWSWVGHKDEIAEAEAARTGTTVAEPWRIFFLAIDQILEANYRGPVNSPGAERHQMIANAAQLEVLLTGLSARDIGTISKYLVNLPAAIATFKLSRDTMVDFYIDKYASDV